MDGWKFYIGEWLLNPSTQEAWTARNTKTLKMEISHRYFIIYACAFQIVPLSHQPFIASVYLIHTRYLLIYVDQSEILITKCEKVVTVLRLLVVWKWIHW